LSEKYQYDYSTHTCTNTHLFASTMTLKSTVSSLGTEQHDRRTELGLKDMGRIDGQECTNTLLVLVIHVVIIPFTTIDLQ
jgi:hypothetical protein